MNSIQIWHNPRCSKSREALAHLQDEKQEFEIIKYLDTPQEVQKLKVLFKMLGFTSVREWMRTKEDIYKELNLKDETDEEKLFEAMAEHPKLIERPVIIKGDRAIIARPPSLVKEFLES